MYGESFLSSGTLFRPEGMPESFARNICGSEAVNHIGIPHWLNTPCTKMPKNCLTPCCKLEIKKEVP